MQFEPSWYEDAEVFHWLAHTVQWGTAPAWFAFVAAAVAAVFTGRSLKIANDTRREAVEESKKKQASVVAAWLTTSKDSYGEDRIAVMFANGSDIPVYEATIWLRIGDDRISPVIDYPSLAPASSPHELMRATREIERANPGGAADFLPILRDFGHLDLAMQFRDSSNIWWFRGFDGSLSEGKSGLATWREAEEARLDQQQREVREQGRGLPDEIPPG